jgi:hypothetical protein
MSKRNDDTVFTCESCGALALRSQREIARDCGERIYEDVDCASCQRVEERKITGGELASMVVSGRIQ